MLTILRRRSLTRIVARLAVVTLLSGACLAITAGQASAATVPCPDGATWKVVSVFRTLKTWEAIRVTLQSSTPVFLVSDGRFLDNGLDVPANYTVTSSVSLTVSVTASTGVDINVPDWLKSTVSTSITASRTTSVGVSISTEVAPHTRVIAEYGLNAYSVDYLIERWRAYTDIRKSPVAGGPCTATGYFPQHTDGPTNVEGWRLRVG